MGACYSQERRKCPKSVCVCVGGAAGALSVSPTHAVLPISPALVLPIPLKVPPLSRPLPQDPAPRSLLSTTPLSLAFTAS